MKKFELLLKMTVVVCIALWAMIGCLHLYNSWRWRVFDEGFERGTVFTGRYVQCFNKLPSKSTQLAASRFVDDPSNMPCEWVAMNGNDSDQKDGQ